MKRNYQSPRPVIFPLVCVAGIIATMMTLSKEEQKEPVAVKKKIVFVAGKPSHRSGEHEHRAGCQLLADHLNRSGLPVEAVVTTHGWPQDRSVFDGASAVVIYSDGGGGHPAIRELADLRRMAEAGVGIGCIHYAVEIPKGEEGNTLMDLIGGYFETHWSVNPHWDASFKIPAHEVTRGIADFQMRDEWYYHMRFRNNMEGVTPILSALPPDESLTRPDGPHSGNPHVRAAVLERKEPQHVMWTYQRPREAGGARAFGFTGGHFHKNWRHDDHRRVVLNAIAWISGIEVPANGVSSQTPTDEEMSANLDPKN
jgi:type 1 glutamine amidotransferase